MKRLLLLLGSGISYPSGLPTLKEITDFIFEADWRQDNLYKWSLRGHNDCIGEWPDVCIRFLLMLRGYADAYYSVRSGLGSNYEVLYYLAKQLEEDARGAVDNPAIDGFIRDITGKVDRLKQRTDYEVFSQHKNDFLPDLCMHACSLIEKAVEIKLRRNVDIKGLDLIAELANDQDVDRVDIVTLNHDLLIEGFLKKSGISYTDGFEEPDGDVRFFNRSTYIDESKVHLLKLHGSMDWFRVSKKKDYALIPEHGYAQIHGDIAHAKDSTGTFVDHMQWTPSFLIGTHNKMVQYGFDIYSDLMQVFHDKLHGASHVAACGYGWGDRGVNLKLRDWFSRSTSNRLIVMHEGWDRKDIYQNLRYWAYSEEVEKDKHIDVIPKWLKDTKLDELKSAFI